MFKKIFSRKKQLDNDNSIAVSAEQKVVLDSLKNYHSDLFVDSILTVCIKHHIEESANSIDVALEMPFPCQGELSILADTLSEQLSKTVNINVE